MTTLLAFAVLSLPVLLLLARLADERRQRVLERQVSDVLSPEARWTLDRLELVLGDHRMGVELGASALHARDRRILRAAVLAIEAHAPSVRAGFEALSSISRTVAVLVPPPPTPARAWRGWGPRGLAAAAAALGAMLVTGTERVRLRLWLLGRALQLGVRAVRRGVADVEARDRWAQVEAAVHDLHLVGAEAGVTYARVVLALDAVGAFGKAYEARLGPRFGV